MGPRTLNVARAGTYAAATAGAVTYGAGGSMVMSRGYVYCIFQMGLSSWGAPAKISFIGNPVCLSTKIVRRSFGPGSPNPTWGHLPHNRHKFYPRTRLLQGIQKAPD